MRNFKKGSLEQISGGGLGRDARGMGGRCLAQVLFGVRAMAKCTVALLGHHGKIGGGERVNVGLYYQRLEEEAGVTRGVGTKDGRCESSD